MLLYTHVHGTPGDYVRGIACSLFYAVTHAGTLIIEAMDKKKAFIITT